MSNLRRVIQNLEVNQTIKEYFLLTNIQSKLGKNGPYFEMTLADASGEVKARKWDLTDKDLQFFEIIQKELPAVVLVKGMTRQFQKALDMKVFYIVIPQNDEQISVREFIPHAPIAMDEAFKQIEETIDKMKNDKLYLIVNELYRLYRPFLVQYPASTHHHQVYGGLVWHTFNTLQVAKLVIELYPGLFDADLLLGGAILHDLAKIKDYHVQQGTITNVTDKAKMIGHIVGMAHEIRETARRLDIDVNSSEVEALEHLILSHHGKGEHGSPVEPILPEAIALHAIVVLDTKLGAVYSLMENTQLDEWSDWSKLLETRVKKQKW
ncbi:3'-5' exoribonuclease YhaM family protein [Anaerobacillus sp. MEB173]|uniref:3'-5' exoribonuclease YhaM family protein n=1 Tax=Anaerobacillus sp. MEB173 TaxID=3383345 RepID=UPI003F91CB0B